MKATLSAFRQWVLWVSSPKEVISRGTIYWSNGWQVPFWLYLNLDWLRLNDPRFSNRVDSESYWDPDEPY